MIESFAVVPRYFSEAEVSDEVTYVEFQDCAPGRMSAKWLMTPLLLMGFCDRTIEQALTVTDFDTSVDFAKYFTEADVVWPGS